MVLFDLLRLKCEIVKLFVRVLDQYIDVALLGLEEGAAFVFFVLFVLSGLKVDLLEDIDRILDCNNFTIYLFSGCAAVA